MRIPAPERNYSALRLSKLNSDEFRHLKLLLFWPIFGLMFVFVERYYTVEHYYSVFCAADELIPFCEWFVIPYLFWFAYIVGMHLYTLLYDIDAFVKMMRFVIISYGVTILIYFFFPTCQELRPIEFARDNVLTRFMAAFYEFDTNTNVCPSLHVIGSLAVMLTSYHCKRFSFGQKLAFTAAAVLICASTVFLKQHSLVDVLAALPLSAVAYIIGFRCRKKSFVK